MNVLHGNAATLALAVGILAVAAAWRTYGLLSRRSGSGRDRDEAVEEAPGATATAAATDLPEYAASRGWDGPSAALAGEPMAASYAERMLRNLSEAPRGGDGEVHVGGPWFADVYSGQLGDRRFRIGNAWIGDAGSRRPGSVCVLHLAQVLPPLFVNLRRHEPFMRFGLREVAFESERFNRTFRVVAPTREYATDVITERTMGILLERDDWVFALEFDRLVCVAASGLGSAADYTARLDALTRFADLIPRFVQQDRGLHMPTLPDGTVLDPGDPASRERFEQALLAMSPQERQAALAEVREEGARFLAGMLGKDLPPAVQERLRDAAFDPTTGDPSDRDTPGPAATDDKGHPA